MAFALLDFFLALYILNTHHWFRIFLASSHSRSIGSVGASELVRFHMLLGACVAKPLP